MRKINVSFTGSRRGISSRQQCSLDMLIDSILHTYNEVTFHHGDCMGADAEFHKTIYSVCYRYHSYMVAKHKYVYIQLYPSTSPTRAFCDKEVVISCVKDIIGVDVFAPKQPLVRNVDIVNASNFLIACPNRGEVIRSGTWSTIRRAREAGKSIMILEF